MLKRAYTVTVSEMSTVFLFIGLLVCTLGIVNLFGYTSMIEPVNPGLAGGIRFAIVLVVISLFFFLISMVMPNYAITKNNLNILIDRLTSPDHIGWIRFTRDGGIRFHTAEIGSHGQCKSMANGKKADVINNGDYTVTAENGNKLICVNDFLSHNMNMDQATGWTLVKKHFGIIGYDVYGKALDLGKTLFKQDGWLHRKDKTEETDGVDLT